MWIIVWNKWKFNARWKLKNIESIVVLMRILYGKMDEKNWLWYKKYLDKAEDIWLITDTKIELNWNITRWEMAYLIYVLNTSFQISKKNQDLIDSWLIRYSYSGWSVFFDWKEITWADIKTFAIVEEDKNDPYYWYAKDKNCLYYYWKCVDVFDPNTFTYIWDNNEIWLYIAKDKNGVYFLDKENWFMRKKIPNVIDIKNITDLWNNYVKINWTIYKYNYNSIWDVNTDIKSPSNFYFFFIPWRIKDPSNSSIYGTDGISIYCLNQERKLITIDADINTFEVMDFDEKKHGINEYSDDVRRHLIWTVGNKAKDKNNKYLDCGITQFNL